MSSSTTRRTPTTNILSQRKRAPVACQFCRLRKTKCDGVRPTCGFCRHHDAQCVWGPATESLDSTPAEKEIMRRLDELKSLLTVESSGSRSRKVPDAGSAYTPGSDERPHSITAPGNQPILSGPLTSPYDNTRCESMLAWPIFRDIVDPSDLDAESFVLEASNESTCAGESKRRNGQGIQEEQFLPLCQKFLLHVHTRNPILDQAELIQYAKDATEHGVEWDGPSCLVLLACALACYTAPWQRPTLHRPHAEQLINDDIATAEAYYFAAKKRFGLLGWSLIDIQCLFFASVYEKYTLNPLQAWFYIQQASSRLQAHLKRHSKPYSDMTTPRWNTDPQELEQRAFWSIYKAEHELLPELPLRSSGIDELTRADSMFPTPPVVPVLMAQATSSGIDQQVREERSWAFYLAEISIRRTISDTIFTLYRKGTQYWSIHIRSVLQQCRDCEEQIQMWYSHLPLSIQFDKPDPPDNELSFFLQGRFYQWRAYVFTPLLYYAVHHPAQQSIPPEVLAFSREAVSIYAARILHNDNHHRHGGTWFTCRGTFASALLILGVVHRSNPNLLPPVDWESLVIVAISTLKRWESQSGDIRRLRETLEKLSLAISSKLSLPTIGLTNAQ
ncbi:hypothetical protein BKA63DRAFT_180642 [Paraphoma chrysanthemicola]|nr:hypothetical protein BKA63DRAFT_180642 [Paraphoma chrysanthemicola]